MSNLTRHVAKVANTDQRCIVAMMQIPNREDHALIIPVDGLTPRTEQAIMQVLQSPEGQQEETFANALHRHRMPDNGKTILASLHESGKLIPMPVGNIIMMPQLNNPVKLTKILEDLGRLPGQMHDPRDKFNPHENNQKAVSSENARAIARNLIVEAEMLEADARKKRKQAAMYDPSSYETNMPSDGTCSKIEIDSSPEELTPLMEAKKSEMDARLERLEMMIMNLVKPQEETEEVSE